MPTTPARCTASPAPLPNARASRSRSDAERAAAISMLELLRGGGDVRVDKVERVKSTMDGKTYENPFKLQIAIERLIDDLARQ